MTIVDLSTIEKDRLLEKINTWDDWYRIENTIFKIDQWPELDIDEAEKMLSRKSMFHEGKKWECISTNYAVERELEYEYEMLRQSVFDKLEPKSAIHNKKHPEWYGKQCIFCCIWTRNYDEKYCPFCGNALLLIALNEN